MRVLLDKEARESADKEIGDFARTRGISANSRVCVTFYKHDVEK